MAIVRKLEKIGLERKHTEVECTYSIIENDDGVCLQVDTYGSSQRWFSPGAIVQLKEIISKLPNKLIFV